jgi:hypothetical protein
MGEEALHIYFSASPMVDLREVLQFTFDGCYKLGVRIEILAIVAQIGEEPRDSIQLGRSTTLLIGSRKKTLGGITELASVAGISVDGMTALVQKRCGGDKAPVLSHGMSGRMTVPPARREISFTHLFVFQVVTVVFRPGLGFHQITDADIF